MFNLRGLNKGGKKKTKKPKGRKPKGRKPKSRKPKGKKPKGTKQRKKSSKRKKSSARRKAGKLINKYDLVKIPENDGSYELGIVLEKNSSHQYHNILFENGQTGEVKINKITLHKNQNINFNVREKENEIENLISAFNKVLLIHGDPKIPGTGSQSGEMIEKGSLYKNKIRFDVFAAAANGRPFREEIMNVISCCREEYQDTRRNVFYKDDDDESNDDESNDYEPKQINCSRNRN